MKYGSFGAFVWMVLAQVPVFAVAQPVTGPLEVEEQIVLLGQEMAQVAEVSKPSFAAGDGSLEKRWRESVVFGLNQRLAVLRGELLRLEPTARRSLWPRFHELAAQLKRLDSMLGTGSVPAATHTAAEVGPLGGIAGTVTAETTGDPVASFVNLFTLMGFFVGSSETDVLGDYEFTDLPAGTYVVTTSNFEGLVDELYDNRNCPGGFCNPTVGDAVSVDPGRVTAGIDFALSQGGTVSGHLTEAATGFPLTDQAVFVYEIRNGNAFTVATAITDSSGNYLTFESLPSGNYFARTSNNLGLIDEVYDDVACTSCDPASGTPFAVTAPDNTPNIDFALDQGGGIVGSVTAAATGNPLPSALVEIVDAAGRSVEVTFVIGNGQYFTQGGLATGTYFVHTFSNVGLVDEVYDDHPCEFCQPEIRGTPVLVTAPMVTPGINMALEVAGSLSGLLTEEATGDPVPTVFVEVVDEQGATFGFGLSAADGRYTVANLPAGMFYAITVSSFITELYDDVPCPSDFCDLSAGTPVPVVSGLDTPDIDFDLGEGGFVSGRVTDEATGVPLGGVLVALYDGSGNLAYVGLTDFLGGYVTSSLAAGNYFATTTNTLGYTDELFDNLPCPEGTCTPTTGTAIGISPGVVTSDVDFALRHSTNIFRDGFASGDTSRWSSVVP